MARVEHIFKTGMDQETALPLTKEALASYVEAYPSYSPIVEWKDNQARFACKIKGFTVNGILKVIDGDGHIWVNMPALFVPFKSQVLDAIEGQIKIQMDARGIPHAK